MSLLFTENSGQGRNLLALHGWGMNSHIWQPIKSELSQCFACTWLDLPGHGHNRQLPLGDLDTTLEQLEPYVPDQCILLGWSLGGVLAQALAQKIPEKISALVLVASSPGFVQQAEWENALPQQILNDFAKSLQSDYVATLRRFFALQFMGTRHAPKQLKQLQQQVLTQPAHPEGLEKGLELLQTYQVGVQFDQPVLWILGERDQLVPARLAGYLQSEGQNAHIIPGAGHVPFVTHKDDFLKLFDQFCQQQGIV